LRRATYSPAAVRRHDFRVQGRATVQLAAFRNQLEMTDYTEKFDATGLNCPLPILRSKKVLTGMNSGDVLYVISTDSGSVKDFDAFCKQTGHELLESSEAEGKYHYYIKKA
jgi:tRNA 2-thiouridine synthesizing protein A